MFILKFISAVVISLVLFFSQQNTLLHILQHVSYDKTQQQDKQSPHPNTCEQCAHYAQFGSIVASSDFSFAMQTPALHVNPLLNNFYLPHRTPAASARDPPVSPKPA